MRNLWHSYERPAWVLFACHLVWMAVLAFILTMQRELIWFTAFTYLCLAGYSATEVGRIARKYRVPLVPKGALLGAPCPVAVAGGDCDWVVRTTDVSELAVKVTLHMAEAHDEHDFQIPPEMIPRMAE